MEKESSARNALDLSRFLRVMLHCRLVRAQGVAIEQSQGDNEIREL